MSRRSGPAVAGPRAVVSSTEVPAALRSKPFDRLVHLSPRARAGKRSVQGGSVAIPTLRGQEQEQEEAQDQEQEHKDQECGDLSEADVDVRLAALETVARRRLTVLRSPSELRGTPARKERAGAKPLVARGRGGSSASATSSTASSTASLLLSEDPARDVGNGAWGENGAYARMRIAYTCVTRPGNDPAKRQKENQDTYCVRSGLGRDEDCFSACVFDGHGPHGARASAFVRDRLLDAWEGLGLGRQSCQGEEEVRRVLHNGCVEVNRRLAGSSVDAYVSGSTGIMAVLKRDALYVANVGDSRAVLARAEGPGGRLQALDLSEDHKPDRPDELARILRHGGRVFEWGVPRVWRGDADMPGLAMARSFGDLAAESVGVFAEPEVTHTKLAQQRDRFLILATDGVWEFLSSADVVAVVERHAATKPPPEAARDACVEVVRLSVAKWNAIEDVVDDCTCVIVALQ